MMFKGLESTLSWADQTDLDEAKRVDEAPVPAPPLTPPQPATEDGFTVVSRKKRGPKPSYRKDPPRRQATKPKPRVHPQPQSGMSAKMTRDSSNPWSQRISPWKKLPPAKITIASDAPASKADGDLTRPQWARKTRLETLLREDGMEWRDDSVLCRQWVEQGSDEKYTTAHDIVNKMGEAKFMWEYCNYDFGRTIANNSRDRRKQVTGKKMPSHVYLSLLRRCVINTTRDGEMPWRWPWLNNITPEQWKSTEDVTEALKARGEKLESVREHRRLKRRDRRARKQERNTRRR